MPKKRKVSPRVAAAGARNLAAWKAANPEAARKAHFKHGALSQAVVARYKDRRTREGKQLHNVIRVLSKEYAPLTPAMNHVLNSIRTKYIIITRIVDWLDEQPCILNERGEPLPCIALLLQCDEGIQRSLERLDKFARTRPSEQGRSLHEIVKKFESND